VGDDRRGAGAGVGGLRCALMCYVFS